MPRNNSLVFLALMVMLLAALGVTALHGLRGYENLLLVTPRENHAPQARLDVLEELNEVGMLTYEVNQESMVQAGNNRYSVIVKGTNYTFPFVMRTNVLRGGFFTKGAEERGSKVAVLNELAAFEIFGGMDCVGNEIRLYNSVYTIVGVIDDAAEEGLHVYVPAILQGGLPGALLFLMDGGLTIAHVENECKQAGIMAENYDFIDLGAMGRVIRERAAVAVGLFVCAMMACAVRWGIRRWMRRMPPWPMAGTGIAVVAAAGVFIITAAQCIEAFVRWGSQEWPQIFTVDGFQEKIRFLQNAEGCSYVLFAAFCVVLVGFLAMELAFPRVES